MLKFLSLFVVALAASTFAAQPNVIFSMTDQHSADATSCRMGDRYIKTSALDSLAAQGTFFTRAYSSNPLCMPARNSIFTDRYPLETGVTDNAEIAPQARFVAVVRVSKPGVAKPPLRSLEGGVEVAGWRVQLQPTEHVVRVDKRRCMASRIRMRAFASW